MSDGFTRIVLWLAALVLGIHIGGALYEMLVVTPLWAGNPPQSVREWSGGSELAVQPLTYKLPAVVALSTLSLGLLAAGLRRGSGRGWIVLAGLLGAVLAAVTVFHSLPILRRTMLEGGAALEDAQLLEQVRAWILWSRVRLVLLVLAWVAAVTALVQVSANRSQGFFRSDLRWK